MVSQPNAGWKLQINKMQRPLISKFAYEIVIVLPKDTVKRN